MNANVSESNIIVDEAIVQPNIKEKVEVRKVLYKVVKRLIDILGGLVGCVLLVPITVAVYIARKVLKEDDGPMFYEHLRYGKDGKKFRIYKFRSMCIDADKRLKEYLEQNEEARIEFEENHKLKDDPRITKLGKFIRKTSIDELPQFVNVLKGDMSLIGPRPIVDGEIEKYGENKDKFLSVRPGLTGYWAANGRSDITYEERMKMELYYVDNISFKLDIQIFFKTIISVMKKEGAM
jgi:lipopolysaccharide/colanic/teichoic acid biosynthesis glycosyltransferase